LGYSVLNLAINYPPFCLLLGITVYLYLGWCKMTRKWLFNGISIGFTTLRTMQCKGISVARFITVGHWSCYPACLAGLNHLGPNTQGAYMSYIHLTLFVGFRTVQRKFISGIFCTLHKFQHSADSPFHFAFRWQYERLLPPSLNL
jgi:hypothetical protein